MKNATEIFIGVVLNVYIALVLIDIFTLIIHDNRKFSCLPVSLVLSIVHVGICVHAHMEQQVNTGCLSKWLFIIFGE